MEMTMTVDATDRELDEAIAQAREVLMNVVAEDPDRWWTPYELKARARDGCGSGVAGLALRELLRAGRLEQRQDFRVRLTDQTASS
jgi:hypothetical protein